MMNHDELWKEGNGLFLFFMYVINSMEIFTRFYKKRNGYSEKGLNLYKLFIVYCAEHIQP